MPRLAAQGREYPWPDPTTITFRESKLIRDQFGVSVMNMLTTLSRGEVDEDVLLAMFVLAKFRADGDFDMEKILDLTITDISFLEDEEPEEEGTEEAPLTDSKPHSANGSKKKTKNTSSKTS